MEFTGGMRNQTTLGNHLPRLDLRMGLGLIVALQVSSCRESSVSTPNPGQDETHDTTEGPATRPSVNAGDDGGTRNPSSVSTSHAPDAEAPVHAAGDGGGTTDAAEIRDASTTWSRDAQSPDRSVDAARPDAMSSAAHCDVDACNNAGTCIVRDWWTECDCNPAGLPECDYPRFRVLGQSRTDFERTMYLLSGDGHVVAGSHGFDPVLREPVGVTWTLEDGLVMLEQDPTGPTLPTGINEDGSLISGRIDRPGGRDVEVLWRDGRLERVSLDAGTEPVPGTHPIAIPDDGTVPSQTFFAFDSTNDGKLVVGRAARDEDSAKEAAFWTTESGVVFLADYLLGHDVDVRRWELWHVNAVSDDGKTMMGLGIGPDVGYRWYLQMEAPTR